MEGTIFLMSAAPAIFLPIAFSKSTNRGEICFVTAADILLVLVRKSLLFPFALWAFKIDMATSGNSTGFLILCTLLNSSDILPVSKSISSTVRLWTSPGLNGTSDWKLTAARVLVSSILDIPSTIFFKDICASGTALNFLVFLAWFAAAIFKSGSLAIPPAPKTSLNGYAPSPLRFHAFLKAFWTEVKFVKVDSGATSPNFFKMSSFCKEPKGLSIVSPAFSKFFKVGLRTLTVVLVPSAASDTLSTWSLPTSLNTSPIVISLVNFISSAII